MTLDYAPDGLIGILTPQANTTVEPEFNVLLPPGLALLNARLTSPKDTIEARLADYIESLGTSVGQFANAPLKAIAFACTGASYLVGKDREAEVVTKLERRLGIPILTAARAVAASLAAIAAKRIALVSCYPDSLTEASIAYWRSCGLEIVEVARTFNPRSDFHPIYSLNGTAAAAALVTLRDCKADAIVMLGTGMPTLGPIASVAGWHGPPVTSCNLSLAWASVEAAGSRAFTRPSFETWLAGTGWSERLRTRHPAAHLPSSV